MQTAFSTKLVPGVAWPWNEPPKISVVSRSKYTNPSVPPHKGRPSRSETKANIALMKRQLQTYEVTSKYLIDLTGLGQSSVNRRLHLWVKSGEVEVVNAKVRELNHTVQAIYKWKTK